MLVLSRKTGESLVISSDIVVTVVEIDRGKVRIGITAPTAPKEVPVLRSELIKKGISNAIAESDPVPHA